MIHPNYPNLIELLGIKDANVPMPECNPKASSKPDAIKDVYHNRMRPKLKSYAGSLTSVMLTSATEMTLSGFFVTCALRMVLRLISTMPNTPQRLEGWTSLFFW
ncbi:MAG TPA: hypothetical protein DD761_12960 [Cyanobacteria bacterium UBA11691]|nr:hypothetical protein [Cyanobacteria bacterium UBA11691]